MTSLNLIKILCFFSFASVLSSHKQLSLFSMITIPVIVTHICVIQQNTMCMHLKHRFLIFNIILLLSLHGR